MQRTYMKYEVHMLFPCSNNYLIISEQDSYNKKLSKDPKKEHSMAASSHFISSKVVKDIVIKNTFFQCDKFYPNFK